MIGSSKGGVFISYPRKDGEEFAAALRDRLRSEAPDIEIKQDRLVLEGGVGWWNQLAAAIDSVDFLILVMTPHAMMSEVVRKEWRYARQQGVCIYPVKAAPDSELQFASVPHWMSRAHFFDLDKEWPTFLGHLRAGCRAPRVPFMAPDLPPNFVQRPREFEALKTKLLNRETAALAGGGGFGKTTLAAALCHDPDVIENFDDGVLWVTLGQKPDVLAGAITLYAALTNERPAFATIEDAENKIAEILEDRVCLLVIDDIWRPSDLKPFTRGGKNCARFITTRNAGIATEVATKQITVDKMSPEESVRLLQSGVGELGPAKVAELAHMLGDWPLRLELGRALLRRRIAAGDSADSAARYLKTALERKGAAALPVDAIIEASLDTLSAVNKTRLEEFSIFPEDASIPFAVAGALWGLDEFDTQESALEIAKTSLLRLDLQAGNLTIHNDLQSWLRKRIADPIALHRRLVDAWSDWIHLPNDYAWRRLTWHLSQANRPQDLGRVLHDPKWIDAKLAATDINTLIADFAFAKSSPEMERLQRALRLSAHVLARDKTQLRSQLAGRIGLSDPLANGIPITSVSLTPQTPTLTAPGSPLLGTLTGHTWAVRAVAVTPDDARAVSISEDWTLKVWGLTEGTEIRSVRNNQGGLTAVALSANGQQAVAACKDGSLRVIDLVSGTELFSLHGHDAVINAMAAASSANRVVSADNDGILKVWDLNDRAELHTLTGHKDTLAAVAITPDGRRAVSGCVDGTLKLWDLDSGRELRTLTGHRDVVGAVVITHGGRRAISASWDCTFKIWDLEAARELLTFEGHASAPNCLAVTADEKRAVYGCQDHTIRIWDLDSTRELGSLVGHTGSVTSLVITGDQKYVVSASEDNTLKVWDLSSPAEVTKQADAGSYIQGVAVTADGKQAVSAVWENATVWDVATQRQVHMFPGPVDGISALAIFPDGKTAVFASWDKFAVWDLERGNELRAWEDARHWNKTVAVTPDAKRLVSTRKDIVVVWDLQTGKELWKLSGHTEDVNDLALTPDGRTAVSASSDGTLKLWNLDTGTERRTLTAQRSSVKTVALTADGTQAISVSWDETLRVWDLQNGKLLLELKGIPEFAKDVAVTRDGTLAAIASGSGVSLVDLETFLIEAVFTCDGAAQCCVFATDSLLVVGDAAGKVHFLVIERPEDIG